jgi:hypothetical protein
LADTCFVAVISFQHQDAIHARRARLKRAIGERQWARGRKKMTEEQTKTQALLTILQTRTWTKAERASARQEINRYYERKLASLQSALFEAIALHTPEQRTPFEIDEYIHRYHKQAQELYAFINARSFSNELLPRWLEMIEEDDRGIVVWQPKTSLFPDEE